MMKPTHENSTAEETSAPTTAAASIEASFAEIARWSVGVIDGVGAGTEPTQAFAGDFLLLGEIGQGGMGRVFRAYQFSLQRTVAVKILDRERFKPELAEWLLQAEAEAAGRLDHPNIVPVFEAGETEGRCYLIMKLVEGGDLAEWAARLPAPTDGRATGRRHREIARLLSRVAQAVHHAHSRGVIHRDLKPGNILVDESGAPCVADFGLAKVLETKTAISQVLTDIGTVAYMAPEQAGGDARNVTTATDVWALGVIIYELLTGRRPFEADSDTDIRDLIRNREASKPSAHNPRIAKDLETIGLKCLEKEPGHRYGSALALAEDLDRWLGLEPILARPTPVWVRTWKWARRNPALAAMLALVIVITVSLTGVAWSQSREAELAREDEAQVSRFFTRAFRLENTIRSRRELLAEHVLDQAVDDLRDFSGPARTRGAIFDAIGRGYYYLELHKKGIAAHARALRIRGDVFGPNHTNTLSSMNSLALAYHGAGQLTNAIPLYEDARNRHITVRGAYHPETLVVLNNLADAYMDAQRTEEGVRLQEEALRGMRASFGTEHPRTLSVMNSLAAFYRAAGRRTNAVVLHEEVLRIRTAKGGPNAPDTLQSMNNLALSLESVGQSSNAIVLLHDALERRLRVFGTNHQLTALGLHNLANAYYHDDQTLKSLPLFEQSLAMYRRTLSNDHPDLLRTMNNLSTAYLKAGQVTNALVLMEETVALYRSNLSDAHPRTLTAMGNLAEAYGDAGQWTNAFRLHEEVLAQKRTRFGVTNQATLDSIHNLAATYEQAGRLVDARKFAEESLMLHTNMFSPEHLYVADAHALLGRVLIGQRDFVGAESALRRSRDIRRKLKPGHWSVFNAESLRGEALHGQDRLPEAEQALLAGYNGMKAAETRMPGRARLQLREAIARLIRFYRTTNQTVPLAEWSAKLDELDLPAVEPKRGQ